MKIFNKFWNVNGQSIINTYRSKIGYPDLSFRLCQLGSISMPKSNFLKVIYVHSQDFGKNF